MHLFSYNMPIPFYVSIAVAGNGVVPAKGNVLSFWEQMGLGKSISGSVTFSFIFMIQNAFVAVPTCFDDYY